MMRHRKETMMGPNKWDEVNKRVAKETTKYMLNFKEGPTIKMLNMKYFKHFDIANHL